MVGWAGLGLVGVGRHDETTGFRLVNLTAALRFRSERCDKLRTGLHMALARTLVFRQLP